MSAVPQEYVAALKLAEKELDRSLRPSHKPCRILDVTIEHESDWYTFKYLQEQGKRKLIKAEVTSGSVTGYWSSER